MYDVITLGSASWDIFLNLEEYKIGKDESFVAGKSISFPLGSKADVSSVSFSSGGGGTNTAATFFSQGLKVCYCGSLGKDASGKEVIKELQDLGIKTKTVLKKEPTNLSVVLNLPEERTILVYRGASELLSSEDILWKNLKAKWFYLAPFSGKLSAMTEKIVDFALERGIKTALNPGNSQLSLPKIERIIKKVDFLLLNKEEASLLTGIDYKEERKIFERVDKMCPGICVMTKGAEGSLVSDGKNIYSAGILPVKVLDRTGAGDSFGAGFVSGLIKTGDIEYSIQLATANSASCLKEVGAKKGLLREGDNFKKVKVEKL